jgi:hypothetical protein
LPMDEWQIPDELKAKSRIISEKGDQVTLEIDGFFGEGMQGMEQLPFKKTVVTVDMSRGVITVMDALDAAGNRLMRTTMKYEKYSGVWVPTRIDMVMALEQGGMSMKMSMQMELSEVEVNGKVDDSEFVLE